MEKLHKELKGFCKSKGLEEREAAYLLGLFNKHSKALSQPSVSGQLPTPQDIQWQARQLTNTAFNEWWGKKVGNLR